MKFDYNRMTRRFLLGEGKGSVNILTHIQAVREMLSNMRPKTQTEQNRLDVAQQHIKEIRKHARRLQERVSVLEEQVKVLEEGADPDILELPTPEEDPMGRHHKTSRLRKDAMRRRQKAEKGLPRRKK